MNFAMPGLVIDMLPPIAKDRGAQIGGFSGLAEFSGSVGELTRS
ncbi:hypothetical protein [Aureimonas flava]|nr:hypothetical protein [Aureimonas flava]